MPKASAPIAPQTPAPVSKEEATLITEAVRRIFGKDAVVRNYGPDPADLLLHVEADDVAEPRVTELLGLLYAKIDRVRIGVGFTKRGSRISGNDKFAYRQGEVL